MRQSKKIIDNVYSNVYDKAIEMKAKRTNDRKQKRENAYQLRASKRGLIQNRILYLLDTLQKCTFRALNVKTRD